jgi:hypothetical protein
MAALPAIRPAARSRERYRYPHPTGRVHIDRAKRAGVMAMHLGFTPTIPIHASHRLA